MADVIEFLNICVIYMDWYDNGFLWPSDWCPNNDLPEFILICGIVLASIAFLQVIFIVFACV